MSPKLYSNPINGSIAQVLVFFSNDASGRVIDNEFEVEQSRAKMGCILMAGKIREDTAGNYGVVMV